MPEIDREGNFQVEITEYGLREMEAPSQAVCVPIKATITAAWNGEAWEDWRAYQVEASGDIWIGKTDGKTNDKQIEALIKHAGWDGSLAALIDKTFKPTPCSVTVTKDEYKGKVRYRISWLNAFDSVPGGSVSNVDADKVKGLEARFGQTLRALAGNVKRNAPPANGSRPPAPPKPPQAAPVGAAAGGEIPF